MTFDELRKRVKATLPLGSHFYVRAEYDHPPWADEPGREEDARVHYSVSVFPAGVPGPGVRAQGFSARRVWAVLVEELGSAGGQGDGR